MPGIRNKNDFCCGGGIVLVVSITGFCCFFCGHCCGLTLLLWASSIFEHRSILVESWWNYSFLDWSSVSSCVVEYLTYFLSLSREGGRIRVFFISCSRMALCSRLLVLLSVSGPWVR